ncbi:MAG: glycosyltransferase family 4 protein [bacterium]
MRIGLDACGLTRDRTGVGSYAHQLIAHLTKVDDENEYVLFGNKPRRTSLSDFSPPLEGHLADVPLDSLWMQAYLPFKLRKEGIEIFHGLSFTVPLAFGGPRIATIHDITAFMPEGIHTPSTRLKHRLFARASARSAQRIIAVSENTKRDAMALLGIGEERIRVIHLGVSREYRPISDVVELERVRRKYGLPERFILFVGTLEPRKNAVGLIEAYGRLVSHMSDVPKLVIAGKRGWLFEGIFQRVRELRLEDRIIFPGFVDSGDLPGLYNLAEVFVWPTLYEGFGLPPLEAMACGVPVVTSNTSSIPEVVGDGALKVNPRDPGEIAEAISCVLGDRSLRDSLRKKGLERAKGFTWEECARRTVEVYSEFAKR